MNLSLTNVSSSFKIKDYFLIRTVEFFKPQNVNRDSQSIKKRKIYAFVFSTIHIPYQYSQNEHVFLKYQNISQYDYRYLTMILDSNTFNKYHFSFRLNKKALNKDLPIFILFTYNKTYLFFYGFNLLNCFKFFGTESFHFNFNFPTLSKELKEPNDLTLHEIDFKKSVVFRFYPTHLETNYSNEFKIGSIENYCSLKNVLIAKFIYPIKLGQIITINRYQYKITSLEIEGQKTTLAPPNTLVGIGFEGCTNETPVFDKKWSNNGRYPVTHLSFKNKSLGNKFLRYCNKFPENTELQQFKRLVKNNKPKINITCVVSFNDQWGSKYSKGGYLQKYFINN